MLSSSEVFKKSKTEQFYETLEKVNSVITEQSGVRIEGYAIHIARLEAVDKPSDVEQFKTEAYACLPQRQGPQIMRIDQNWID